MQQQRTMAFSRMGTCVVLVHSPAPPSDREWAAYVDFLEAQKAQQTKILVVTEGGSPSAAQRARLTEIFGKKGVPTAVLTDSSIVRGVVQALNWFVQGALRAFAPERLEDALVYLGAPVGFAGDFRKIIGTLKAEIKSNKPL